MQPRLLPYTPERDVYRLLGVPPSASTDEINAACRRLARTFHPDRNRSERANQEMQVVNAVRRVMTDPQSRAAYDQARMRFHAELSRRSVERASEWRPLATRRATSVPPPVPRATATVSTIRPHLDAGPTPLQRYVRGLVAGLRAAVATLLPPRCRRCRLVIDRDDAYCAACGTPLLTGG